MFINETAKESRRFRRLPNSNPVRYECPDLQLNGGCLSCDISEEGIRVNIGSFIPKETVVSLQLRFGPKAPVINRVGRVAWSKKMAYSDRYLMGFKFIKT